MWLLDLFKKKKQNVIVAKTNISGENLNRLTADGELPFGWLNYNKHLVKPYEEKMISFSTSLKSSMSDEERISKLKAIIATFYEYKSFCYSRNECFKKYFCDMWEHCSNSKSKDFSFVTKFEKELLALENKINRKK